MTELPKLEKLPSHLDQTESLQESTVKLLMGFVLSTGIILGANAPSDAKPVDPTMSTPPVIQASAIVLTPATKQMAASAFLAQHYSHRSHMSHSSHRSHYSSRY